MSYQKIKFKIQYLEQRIKNELIRSKKDKNSGFKDLSLKGIILPKFRLLFLSIGLLFWNIVFNIARFYFILFKDPALSFNLFFNQKNLEVCNYSYCDFKIIQKKVRLFSFTTFSTIVVCTIITSLILNLATGPIQYSEAATYYWVQNDWTTQSSTPANHTSNRIGWVNYLVKDSNLSAGADLSLASTDGSWAQTSDSDFNEGTYDADEIEVNDNDIALKLDCGLCGEHIWGSGCVAKAAGDYDDIPACQRCDGVHLTTVNYTDNTQDTVGAGANKCDGLCEACQSGSCGYADSSTDPGSNCGSDVCNPMCNGSGSCNSSTTTNTDWGIGPTGCDGTDKRCYDSACITCGSWMNAGYCWYHGDSGASCHTVCNAHGGIYKGTCNWVNDPADCSTCLHWYPGNSCDSHAYGPYRYWLYDHCRYHLDGHNDCKGLSSINRICACNK